MSNTILLTGGTGFLGMELIARLLEEDEGPEVILAVRACDGAEAQRRIEGLLAQLYEEPPVAAGRLRAVAAELTVAGMGLLPRDRREVVATVDRVVHCAASISFTLPLEEARAINVAGTRSVLDLAREIHGIERFVHVSTAYVAGRLEGCFDESDLDGDQEFRNTYERTKFEAEQLVTAADDLPTVTVRPSIVVGEADSGWTSAFNVIYWPLQAFARGLLDELPADPEGIVDVVSVDHVTGVLAHALLAGEVSGTLHAVSGSQAPRVCDLVAWASDILGRPAPALVSPRLIGPDRPGAEFAAYFDVRANFDDHRTQAQTGLIAPPPGQVLDAILDYAQLTRWGKRPLTRQAARERLLAPR